MAELLAPAGNYEAFIAAVSNGADAVYIGLNKYSARAYAENFTFEEIAQAVTYAHLRNVKIYVTLNTIVYDDELVGIYQAIDQLYLLNVDALIVQDLAIIEYTTHNYPDMEVHASTQMGIDDLDGVRVLEKLGAKRVVLARETSISKIAEIKKNSKMELEAFIHGALCVSYSGNCLMSGLIGMRSGNRGRCVGSCRKLYQLVDTTNTISYPPAYLLSMKDLNTTENIKDLLIIDSLKIEGRMKDPTYVASITSAYRELLDNPHASMADINERLTKTFNRTFTKGYLFGEDKGNITNITKPNNFGYYIGKVANYVKGQYQLKLVKPLNQGDQIRIDSKVEINLPVNKMYDDDHKLISTSSSSVFLECSEKAAIGDAVYKTKDKLFLETLTKTYPREFKRLPLTMYLTGEIGSPLTLTIFYQDQHVIVASSNILEKAINSPTSFSQIEKQLGKLTDTPYFLEKLECNIKGSFFIVVKELNELRRVGIEALNSLRLMKRSKKTTSLPEITISTVSQKQQLAVKVTTDSQYQAAIDAGINNIYYQNIIPRNNAKYQKITGPVLVGGYGSLMHYQKQEIITDYSFNVVNTRSIAILTKLGASRITLSHELNRKQIKDLIDNFNKQFDANPNLEMIVYGRQALLVTKYCLLNKLNLCGSCKKNEYIIKDDVSYFPVITSEDCTNTIYNGKILNLIDNLPQLNSINVLRLEFTTESYDETIRIINCFQKRLEANTNTTKLFDEKTNTRGHYNREIF